MPDHSQLTAIAIVGLAALICGMIMTRLRQPAIVGYILAGIILGPSAAGLVENRDQINTLADLGVLMLLFLIGMELSLTAFKKVWRTALLCSLMQIAGSLAVMLGLSRLLGWPLGLSVLLGFVVALSSTAVAIRMLDDIGMTKTETGRITIAVLIAQDLAVVPMMLVIHGLAGAGFGAAPVARIVLSIAFLVVLVVYLSRGPKIRLPLSERVMNHADLAPLSAFALCLGAAALTGVLGFSPAYGAFLAGLVIGNSTHRATMIRTIRPVQSILIMVFFLSIGLLIDLGYIWENIERVMVLLVIVTVFKTAFNVVVLRLLGQPWQRASLAGVLLGQVGEFSFVLAAIALTTGLIEESESRLVIAIVALSLIISPLWYETARRLKRLIAPGIDSIQEILRLLYGKEAAFVVTGSHQALERARILTAALGRRLEKRRRARGPATNPGGGPEDKARDKGAKARNRLEAADKRIGARKRKAKKGHN